MPITYTPSGLSLIGDGEEAGTWGSITNINLQILSQLTSEAATIALAGTTHTLNVTDGTVAGAGQYAVLLFGGAPSGTNTVTISPNDAKRVFIVSNTSGQSVVLTQGSGGNVTVANNGKAIVYCNGGGASAAVTDLTPLNPALAAIGALTPTDGNFIVGNGTTWVAESGDTVLTSIGVTASTTELNVLDGITASTAELNILDGVTADATELNYVEGVTSSIQTQLDAKALQTTTITAGTGLTGGGDLSTNRTISPDIASQAEAEAGTAADKLMTPQRTAQAITALAPAAGMEALGRVGVTSSVASITISTPFDSSKYSSYVFVLSNVIPATDGVNLYLRTSSNGGFSYDAGASDYKYTILSNAQTGGGTGTGTEDYILLVAHAIGSAAGEDGVSGTLTLTGAGTTKKTSVVGSFGNWRNDGAYVSSYVAGARDSAAIVNGVQFLFSSGNIESGTIEMYGLRTP